MLKFKKLVNAVVFSLLTLLTLLLFFESYVSIPAWLHTLGRMHPLVLHFPIAFIVLLILLQIFRKQIEEISFHKINTFLLLLTAASTTVAVVMGFFLYTEGYASTSMTWHKWTGISLAYISYFLLLIDWKSIIHKGLLFAMFPIVVLAGHYGANLSHGSDFIFEPLAENKNEDFDENQPLFVSMIQPVFKEKCYSCHNTENSKGGLDMSSLEAIRKGGEHGPLWAPRNLENSSLIQRAELPLDDKKHMPPKGKKQLTEEELSFLKTWILEGADTAISVAKLPKNSKLGEIVSHKVAKEKALEKAYDFDFVAKETIKNLNIPFRTVDPLSPKSPALEATIFGNQTFKPEFITDLLEVKDQLVHLNLANLPIKKSDLENINKFKNLERLNLNNTPINDNDLKIISSCKNIQSLSLSGTKVGTNLPEALALFPNLSSIFLWNTEVTDTDVKTIKANLPNLNIDLGDIDNGEQLKLSPPILKNKENLLGKGQLIALEHKMAGVEIRYTLDDTNPNDSSLVYTKPIAIGDKMVIKSFASKKGWANSTTKMYKFYDKGFVPKSAKLQHQPLPAYPGNAEYLIDGVKTSNPLDIEWIGFGKLPLVATFDFGEQAPTINKIVFDYGIVGYKKLLPPESIEVWGGSDASNMKKLISETPVFNKKTPKKAALDIELLLNKTNFRYYTIKAFPYKKLPKWHSKKGQSGLIATDHIFFF